MLADGIATQGTRNSGNSLANATRGYQRRYARIERPSTLPVDVLGRGTAASSIPFDFRGSVEQTGEIPFEWYNGNAGLVISHVALPVDILKTQIALSEAPTDWNVPVSRIFAYPFDWGKTVAQTGTVIIDYRKTLEVAKNFPSDSRKNIASSRQFPFDHRTRSSRQVQAPIDWRKPVISLHALPFNFLHCVDKYSVLPVSIEGGWGYVVFMHPAGAVHFYKRPQRGLPQSRKVYQPAARDSDGAYYNATKGARPGADVRLNFKGISKNTLAYLRYFIDQTVRGTKSTFTYYDVNSQTHTVRFASPKIRWTQTGANKVDVEIDLEM